MLQCCGHKRLWTILKKQPCLQSDDQTLTLVSKCEAYLPKHQDCKCGNSSSVVSYLTLNDSVWLFIDIKESLDTSKHWRKSGVSAGSGQVLFVDCGLYMVTKVFSSSVPTAFEQKNYIFDG